MTGQNLRQVFDSGEERRYKAGERLYEAGSESESVYLVTSGRFVLEDGDGRWVASRAEGFLIGEAAALDGGPRTVTVRAEGDASVLTLPTETFRQRLQEDARAAYEVAAYIAGVLREASRA